MMKAKKSWLWISAAFALVAVVAWVSWSEYGKGYSEDQRRNWNEMVEARARGGIYSSRALENRSNQGDAPEWKIDFSKPPLKLPLEGMTVPGLGRIADQGNGDACLELAFRARSSEYNFDFYLMGKNVGKAVQSGRAGSDYLLRLLEYRKSMGKGVKGSDVDGYADFVSLLGKGDFMLGKVYACLVKGDDHAMNSLDSALRERAKGGDVEALRNAGYLGMLRKSVSMDYLGWGNNILHSIMGNNSYYSPSGKMMLFVEDGVGVLPDLLKPEDQKLREMGNWLDGKIRAHYWRKLHRGLEPSFAMLMQAAKQGDLHAKYLWTHYVIWARCPLSKDEWRRYLSYANELLAVGGIYRGGAQRQYFDCGSFPLAEAFYRGSSVHELWRSIQEQEDKEYSAFKKSPDVPENIHRLDMEALCDMNEFAKSLVADVDVFGRHELSKEEQQHGYQLLEEAANEGNPLAMFCLARLLNAGLIVEQDVARSWQLLQKAKVWCDGLMDKDDSVLVSAKVKQNESLGMSLDDAIEWQMLDITSRCGDMPGMSEEEAVKRLELKDLSYRFFKIIKEQFEKRGVKIREKR